MVSLDLASAFKFQKINNPMLKSYRLTSQKIKKDEFAPSTEIKGREERAEFKKYLNGKPQDLFTYFKDQGLKEEK